MNEREMWEYPKATLKTKYGDREITITEATHAHISHPGYVNGTAQYMGPIRGIEYHVSAHVHRWSDGTWHIGPNEGIGFNYDFLDGENESNAALEKRVHHPDQWKHRQENHGSLYMTRAGAFTDASKSARIALGTEIERAFNEWVKTDEAIAAFDAGQEKYLRRELESATKDMSEAFAAYEKAEVKCAAASDALTEYLDGKGVTSPA